MVYECVWGEEGGVVWLVCVWVCEAKMGVWVCVGVYMCELTLAWTSFACSTQAEHSPQSYTLQIQLTSKEEMSQQQLVGV